MPTYTEGVPMHESSGMGIEDLYNPETQAYEFKPTASEQAKYEQWKAQQERMYGRYVDLVNASNAYRANEYTDVDPMGLGDTPDFSYGAYGRGESWKDYAPEADMFGGFSYLGSEDGGFRYGVDDPYMQIEIQSANYGLGTKVDRPRRSSSSSVGEQTGESGAEGEQAVADPSSYINRRSGSTPFLDSFMRSRGITGAGPAATVVNTEYNPDGVIYDDISPDGSGGIAGNRGGGMLSGRPQTGGPTPMPNQPMPTRIDPKPPVGRADGNAQDQRLNRPTPFADAFVRSRRAAESRGPVSSLFSRFLKDD